MRLLRSSAFRALRFLALTALASFAALPAQESRKIRDTGPNANRVNLVFLAEGYTAAESAKFFSDAATKLDGLINNEAFAALKDVSNGYAIFVASNQSGADIPADGVVRDTYFNASFGTNGIDRLLAIAPGPGTTRAYSLLGQFVPEFDIVILLVNSTKYGGSGGPISVTSLDASSADIILHEIGHSFAGLVDEYVDAAAAPSYPPYDGMTNTTNKTDRALIPWKNFILPTTPIPTLDPTSDPNFVGSWEGSYFRATGFYRPSYDSTMRSLGKRWGPVHIRAFNAALHRLNLNNATAAPTFAAQPQSYSNVSGSQATLTAAAAGTGPFTYQWLFNGKYIAGATGSSYQVSYLNAATAGSYQVEITNATGTITSDAAALTLVSEVPGSDDSRLYALSCRAVVGVGGDVIIPGIAVGGSGDRPVIVRAKGPALTTVSGPLARPQLKLYQVGIDGPIAQNTGWDTGSFTEVTAIRAATAEAGLPAFPDGSADCALRATLQAGRAYTAVISGLDSTTGIALVEVYEAGSGAGRLAAISCRAVVNVGDNVLIPGVVVVGTKPKWLLIRASAPAGVSGVLAAPQLTLYNAAGAVLGVNAGWSNAANAADIFNVTPTCGLANFPHGSANCAMLVKLDPGGYTAKVAGLNNSVGVALIEVYEVP